MARNPEKKGSNQNLYRRAPGVKAAGALELAGPWPGPGVLAAAVSGGADSVAMLRLLALAAVDHGWRLTVVHVDHGLRPDSADDAAFVAQLAAGLGLPCRVLPVRVRRDGGLSPEEAARQARRQALGQAAEELGAACVALAHTLDDQAETVLARLLTGSGPGGLAAMRGWSGLFWRPLLGLRRQNLRDWLVELGQPWREDPTNADQAFMRNRVRGQLLPLCRELINPRADEALARLAGLSAEEEDYWQRWCQAAFDRHGRREGPSLCLDAAWLTAQEPFLRRRMTRFMAGALTGRGQHLLFEHVGQVERLLAGPPGKALSLPGGLMAWREHKSLRLAMAGPPPPLTATLSGPGVVELAAIGAALVVREVAPRQVKVATGPQAWLPLAAVRWPLTVRWPRVGERFQPLGAPGAKRLSKIAIDRKTPPWWRPRLVLVEDADGPWWVGPLGVAQRAQAGPKEPLLELSLVDTWATRPYIMVFNGSFSEHDLLLPTWAAK